MTTGGLRPMEVLARAERRRKRGRDLGDLTGSVWALARHGASEERARARVLLDLPPQSLTDALAWVAPRDGLNLTDFDRGVLAAARRHGTSEQRARASAAFESGEADK